MTTFLTILAGGSGTRFWPASTRALPKQFLPLAGGKPLLRATYERVAPLAPPERVAVVTAAAFADQVRAMLPELPAENVIGEPAARNTAAACAVAARWAAARAKDAVLATLPADHVVSPDEEFRAVLSAALAHAAASKSLVTLGLRPTFAATGFGWIRLGEERARVDGVAVHRAAAFVEKPDRARAELFLAQGGHLWNLGIFAWRADAFLAELDRLQPAVANQSALAAQSLDLAYAAMPSISVDHGVLEKAREVDCVPCSFAWDDVGSFEALSRHLPKDAAGNASSGALLAVDAKDCVAWNDEGGMTALLGVENLVVVHAHGVTLVAPRSRAEEIRKLVERLGPAGLERFA